MKEYLKAELYVDSQTYLPCKECKDRFFNYQPDVKCSTCKLTPKDRIDRTIKFWETVQKLGHSLVNTLRKYEFK